MTPEYRGGLIGFYWGMRQDVSERVWCFLCLVGGVGRRRGWVAEEATPQRWFVSAERRLFVLGVAVSLASFEEKKEICLYLVWLISSICLLTYTRAKRKQTKKNNNNIHCYRQGASSLFAATQVRILWLFRNL